MKSNKIGYHEGNGRIDEAQKRNGEWADGEQVSECLQAGRSKQSPLKSHHCRIIWIMLQSRVLRVPVWLIAIGEFPGKVPTLIVVIVVMKRRSEVVMMVHVVGHMTHRVFA